MPTSPHAPRRLSSPYPFVAAAALAVFSFIAAAPPAARAAGTGVIDQVDWPAFLARHDMVWTRLPDAWKSGAFMGDGLVGANVFTTDDGAALMWRIGRTDVVWRGSRIPVGELVLKTAGKLDGGSMRLNLWNAELTGQIKTDKGTIALRSFTHAQQLVQVIELKPDAGEAAARFEWRPGLAADPRKVHQKTELTDADKNPDPVRSASGQVQVCTQPLNGGGEHATAWAEVPGPDNSRLILLSVGFSHQDGGAGREAVDNVNKALATGLDGLTQSHRDWWHHYWPESFLSIPDTRLESFYWLQMYKMASATRADRPAMDLMGPWFNSTPWPRIWFNLNIQLTYWPVLTSNRLELGESLCKMLDDGAAQLKANAKEFASDSMTIGRSASYDLARPGGNELCDLPWTMHNYWLQYRYSMDDQMLRDRLFPLLKGSMQYYFHFLTEDADGRLHTTRGFSPEYPNQPTPNPDCNIDLALIRWGCQTLLDACDRLKIDDPMIPTWRRTLDKLTRYPTDENGLRISASVPFAVSHRHYSHLLMVYPLYLMTPDKPADRELITRSLDHWMSMPKALRGYSFTGAASISALLGKGDDAAKYLNVLLDQKILPNTLYTEAGPCIETPLSGAASLHDMLLTSWGNKVRVFPAVPGAWPDVTFDHLRAQGAFLVTASRKGGKTQFVRIESLAGEPCHVVTDLADPVAQGASLRKIADGEYEIDLKKGQTVLLTPAAGGTDLTIVPVAPQQDKLNFYGLH